MNKKFDAAIFTGDVFDLDAGLVEHALDPDLAPSRRMLANAAIGVEPEDAYYSTRELREAAQDVFEGELDAKRRLTRILATPCDDFQRCLYYAVAGRGIDVLLGDLEWLEGVLLRRAQIFVERYKRRELIKRPVRPYLAECPQGPVVSDDANFVDGPSSYLQANGQP